MLRRRILKIPGREAAAKAMRIRYLLRKTDLKNRASLKIRIMSRIRQLTLAQITMQRVEIIHRLISKIITDPAKKSSSGTKHSRRAFSYVQLPVKSGIRLENSVFADRQVIQQSLFRISRINSGFLIRCRKNSDSNILFFCRHFVFCCCSAKNESG